jgi:uncharacterized protein GlcG (DUF336 family)
MLRHRLVISSVVALVVFALVYTLCVYTPTAVAQPDQGSRAGSSAQPGTPLSTQDLSLDQARDVIQAAIQKSREMNVKMNIAVVDAGGNLKGFARMDGAWLGSIDIAQKKARTARYFDMPTGEVGKLSQPGKPLYMIEVSNQGLITFPGGVPIRTQGDVIIGAIGVSGSTVENDDAVARAGASAVK